MAVSPMRAALALLLIATAAHHAAAQTISSYSFEFIEANVPASPTVNITKQTGVVVRLTITGTGFDTQASNNFANAPQQVVMCTNDTSANQNCGAGTNAQTIPLTPASYLASSTSTKLVAQYNYFMVGTTAAPIAPGETGLANVKTYLYPTSAGAPLAFVPGSLQADGVAPDNVILKVDNSTAAGPNYACTIKTQIPITFGASDNWSPMYACWGLAPAPGVPTALYFDVKCSFYPPPFIGDPPPFIGDFSKATLIPGQDTSSFGPRSVLFSDVMFNTSTLTNPDADQILTFKIAVWDAAQNQASDVSNLPLPEVYSQGIYYDVPAALLTPNAFVLTVMKASPTSLPVASGTITISPETKGAVDGGSLFLSWKNDLATATKVLNITDTVNYNSVTGIITYPDFPFPADYVQGGVTTLYAWVTDACGATNPTAFAQTYTDNDVPVVEAAITLSGATYLVPIRSLVLNAGNPTTIADVQASLIAAPWWGSIPAATTAAQNLINSGKDAMVVEGKSYTTKFADITFVTSLTVAGANNFTLVGVKIAADGSSIVPVNEVSGDIPSTIAFDQDALEIYWKKLAEGATNSVTALVPPSIGTLKVDGGATNTAATNKATVLVNIVATPSNADALLSGSPVQPTITAFCVSDTVECGTFTDIDFAGNSTGKWTLYNDGVATGEFTWTNPSATTSGIKVMYVYVRDSYGTANVIATNVTYAYDIEKPVSSAKLANGALCATSAGVATLTIDAMDNLTTISYCVGLNATTDCTLDNQYTAFTLPAVQSGYGYRNGTADKAVTIPLSGATVYTFVRDLAKNGASPANPIATAVRVASASGPVGTALINGGAAQTQTSLVTINLNITTPGAAGAVEVCVQASANVSTCAWQAYAAEVPYQFALTPTNVSQTATVNVWFRDTCGTVSAVVTDSIVLLAGTVPTNPIGVITLNNQSLVMLEVQGNPDTQNFQAPFLTSFYPNKEDARKACLLTALTAQQNGEFVLINGVNGSASIYGPFCAYAPPARRRLLVAANTAMPAWAPYLNGSTIALAPIVTNSNTTNVYYVSQKALDPSTAPAINTLSVPPTAGGLNNIIVNLTATASLGAQINGYCASDEPGAICSKFLPITGTNGVFSGSVPVNLTTPGLRTVYVYVSDTNGFVSDAATGTITISTTAPIVTSAVVTPAYSTGVVSIAVVAVPSPNSAITEYCVTESQNATCTTWTAVTGWTVTNTTASGPAAYTLTGADGAKTLFITVRNSALVASAPFPVTPNPVLDTVAPSVTSVSASTVCGNLASTNVVIAASDNMSPISFCAAASPAALANCTYTLAPGQTATGARNVSYTLTVPTPAASGPVYVAVKDAAGNPSATVVANVTVCLNAPVLNLVVALNINPPQTPTTNIQAFIVPPTGVVALSYCISKNPACIPTIPWNNGSYVDITLDAVSGSQTVYGRLRTAGGDTAPAQQSIIFNTAAEPLGYLLSSTSAINPPYTTSTALTLKTVGGAAPPGFMCVTDKPKPCKPNKPYAESFAFKLSGKQELKTVTPYYGIKNDKNPKAGTPFTITYDKTPPKMSKSKLAFTWTVSGGDGVVGFQDTATDSVSGMTVPGTYKMVWGAKTPKAKCVDGTALTIDVGTGLARSADIAGVTDPKSVKVRLCAIDKAGNVASGITYAPK